ncbi:hypothetical protein [Thalassotalea hakodatensis]|uniref:hypothetical protein n=1 Tax=Thalassotalea hakodatensis TaxID=3030492 RepID=UPI0025732EA2|nr:hypothetical protein [Thalassotalea hakodatensis]
MQTIKKHKQKSSIELLEELGITHQVLVNAVKKGIEEHAFTSPYEPLNAGGSKASFTIIKTLRQQLLTINKGWALKNQSGQCLTVNSENNITVIVTSGDKYTGLSDTHKDPCTKNGKGMFTKDQIMCNYGQTLSLFGDSELPDLPAATSSNSKDENQFWYLLYFFDFGKKEVRFELSLPNGIKEIGSAGKVKVSRWVERNLFAPLPFEAYDEFNDTNQFNEDIDFDVKPRE